MASVKRPHQHAEHELMTNPFLKLQQEVNHAMNDFYDLFEPTNVNFENFAHIKLTPALDIVEDKDYFKVEVEMPGMGEEDIKVSFNENRMTIEGEKTTSKKDENKNYLSREISYGRYERTLTLPASADVSKANATFKKGMLWVVIPKRTESKSNKKTLKIERAK